MRAMSCTTCGNEHCTLTHCKESESFNKKMREILQARFMTAYQSDHPTIALRAYLDAFRDVESRHLDALRHFCRADLDDSIELPGMVYGMIFEAHRQLIDDVISMAAYVH